MASIESTKTKPSSSSVSDGLSVPSWALLESSSYRAWSSPRKSRSHMKRASSGENEPFSRSITLRKISVLCTAALLPKLYRTTAKLASSHRNRNKRRQALLAGEAAEQLAGVHARGRAAAGGDEDATGERRIVRKECRALLIRAAVKNAHVRNAAGAGAGDDLGLA